MRRSAALLVGAILPLDLRLLGAWHSVPLESLARALVPAAATGPLLAVSTGALLFVTRATEYAALGLFLVKLTLIAAASAHALTLHLGTGLLGASRTLPHIAGATSLSVWLAALIGGRMLAFVAD